MIGKASILSGVFAATLLLPSCIITSPVETPAEAVKCEQEGGSVEVNADGETLSCVKQDPVSRFEAFLEGLITSVFFWLIVIGSVIAGIVAVVRRNN